MYSSIHFKEYFILHKYSATIPKISSLLVLCDIKGTIKNHKSKDGQYKDQK